MVHHSPVCWNLLAVTSRMTVWLGIWGVITIDRMYLDCVVSWNFKGCHYFFHWIFVWPSYLTSSTWSENSYLSKMPYSWPILENALMVQKTECSKAALLNKTEEKGPTLSKRHLRKTLGVWVVAQWQNACLKSWVQSPAPSKKKKKKDRTERKKLFSPPLTSMAALIMSLWPRIIFGHRHIWDDSILQSLSMIPPFWISLAVLCLLY